MPRGIGYRRRRGSAGRRSFARRMKSRVRKTIRAVISRRIGRRM